MSQSAMSQEREVSTTFDSGSDAERRDRGRLAMPRRRRTRDGRDRRCRERRGGPARCVERIHHPDNIPVSRGAERAI